MGLRGPLGEKENKREKGKRGAATLVGHMGPTRAAAPPHGRRTPHVGIVPHGGAKGVGLPPSPLYRSAPMP
jgi:hypothetical protein